MTGRRWAWGLLSASWLASAGCTCHLSSVPPVEEEVLEACAAIALDSRSHVYLIFISGLDPLDCAGVKGLKETVQAPGFPNAWSGKSCHLRCFKKVLAEVCDEDPDARFVLVGHGHGIETAAELARVADAHGVVIELFVALGGEADCPSCVARQITVVSCGRGDGENRFEVPAKTSLGVPSHPQTVELLARELFALAGSIPARGELPKMYYPDHEPTPRPVMPPAAGARDEWDFLKPAVVDDREWLPPGTLPESKPGKSKPAREALHTPARKQS